MPPLEIAVKIFLWALFFAVVAVLFLFLYRAYLDSKSPTFELKKDEWVCTEWRTETYIVMQLIGKVMIPTVHTRKVCVRWEKGGV